MHRGTSLGYLTVDASHFKLVVVINVVVVVVVVVVIVVDAVFDGNSVAGLTFQEVGDCRRIPDRHKDILSV